MCVCGGGTGTTPPACGAEAAAGGRWRVPVGAVKRGGAPRAPERAGRAAGVPGGGGRGCHPWPWVPSRPGVTGGGRAVAGREGYLDVCFGAQAPSPALGGLFINYYFKKNYLKSNLFLENRV